MAEEWAGVINANMPAYIKGMEDMTTRDRLTLSLLKNRGRVEYNKSSYSITFDLEFSQPPITAYGDGGILNFGRHDPARQVTLDHRGYAGTDMMTLKERYANRDDVAIYKRYDTILPRLTKSITVTFGGEVYVDGYAAANVHRLVGLDSFMKPAQAVNNTDKVALPSSTYGGRSLVLGNDGGVWSSDLVSTSRPHQTDANFAKDWPDGVGSSEFDYNSPKLINIDHNWGSGTAGWATNADKILRRTIAWMRVTGGKEGRPDICVMNSGLLVQFKDLISGTQRDIIPHKESDDLGFPDVVNFDGVGLHDDFEIRPNTAYMLNIDKMKLCSMASDLFFTHGPEKSIETMSWLFAIGFFGNMLFYPKCFAKIAKFT
jgi:hypothetical protein